MPRLQCVQPVLPVRDVPEALRFYARLGFALVFEDDPSAPRYAGIRRDEVELHLQWHDPAEWGNVDRPVVRLVVEDPDGLSEEFERSAGPLHRTQVSDTPWGTREFHVHDPDQNGLQFYRVLGPSGPPAPAPGLVVRLRQLVALNLPALRAISEADSSLRPAPGKWSPRELLGHLVDSASNNHQRFVRAQFQDSLIFEGYEQDEWVSRQGYQDAPWPELIVLWATFNLHLARVIAATPEAERQRPRAKHNLDRIAFKAMPADTAVSLDTVMADTVDHLQHHLSQLLGAQFAEP